MKPFFSSPVSKFNQWMTVGMLGVTLLGLPASWAVAQETSAIAEASSANSSTNALKQSNNSTSSIQSTCSRRDLRVTHYFETASYKIYLCKNRQGKDFYNGISKRNGSAIILPLISEEGVGMVATNGQYEYLITGASLTISRNNRVIKEEQVIRSTIF